MNNTEIITNIIKIVSNDPLVLFGMILAAFAVGMVVVVFSMYFSGNKRGVSDTQEAAYKKAHNILMNAKKRSIEIMSRAYKNQNKTDKKFDTYLKHLSNKRLKEANNYFERILVDFRKELEVDKEQQQETLKRVRDVLQKEVTEEVSQMRKNVEKETLESTRAANKKIREEYDLLEKEIDQYKREQIELATSKIGAIVSKISTEILGKSIPVEKHQNYILKQLEKELNKLEG